MSDYVFKGAITTLTAGESFILAFGMSETYTFVYDHSLQQMIVKNESSEDMYAAYSGQISTKNLQKSFVSALPGTLATVPKEKSLYFNNLNPLVCDKSYSLSNDQNCFIILNRVFITRPSAVIAYDFDFKIEFFGQQYLAVELLGNKIQMADLPDNQ